MREDKEELLANPALNEFLNDPEILEAASNFGLISPGQDTVELANEAVETLTGIGSNFKKIRNDPEIRSILQDKDIEMKLENQDIKGLIMDPKFNELVNRVLELLQINKGGPE